MEENLDKLFDYRALIPGSGRFASIVGIGGGAGRVVDQMRKCCLPDVQLYAFGMNRKEMDELSLCGKYLIGQEGLGSGKDRFLAEYGKHSKKCTFYTLRFGCSFAAVNTIKPQLL